SLDAKPPPFGQLGLDLAARGQRLEAERIPGQIRPALRDRELAAQARDPVALLEPPRAIGVEGHTTRTARSLTIPARTDVSAAIASRYSPPVMPSVFSASSRATSAVGYDAASRNASASSPSPASTAVPSP